MRFMRGKTRHLQELLFLPSHHHLDLPVQIVFVLQVGTRAMNRLPHRRVYSPGTEAFDCRRERQLANQRAVKELGVLLAIVVRLPVSMHTFPKAGNRFRRLTPQPRRFKPPGKGESVDSRFLRQNAQNKT